MKNKLFENSATLFVILGNWGSRILILLIQIITVPLLLKFLNNKDYSFYLVVVSLSNWFSLSNLGMSSSIQNFLSEYKAKGLDDKEIRAIAGLGIIVLFFAELAVFSLIGRHLYDLIFNTNQFFENKYFWIFAYSSILMLIIGLGDIGYKVFYAELRGYLSNIFPAAAKVLQLIFLLIFTNMAVGNSSLHIAALSFFIPMALFSVISIHMTGLLKNRNYKTLSMKLVKAVIGRNIEFFIYRLLSTVVLGIDYIIMINYLESLDIIKYSIMMQIIMGIHYFYTSILYALWPEWSELMAAGKAERVKKSVLYISVFSSLAGLAAGILLMFITNPVLTIWLHRPDIIISWASILLFGLYLTIRIWADTYGIALLSFNQIRIMTVTVIIQGALSLSLQLFLVKRFGLNGIISALILCYLLTVVWMWSFSFFKKIKTL